MDWQNLMPKEPRQLGFFDELIVDNFAGGGGASTGIEWALGRPVDIAINHDPQAIAMHEANHPMTRHFCESVWEVDPRKATDGKPVALAWFSPDCKHFSKAKGGKPVEKEIRGLAWVAIRWAATVRPRVIMLENVEEFVTWGPLVNGRPCPKRKGQTFHAFVNAFKRQNYKVEYKELVACDYGAPTTRKRFVLIARCDGQPIVWPAPTHGAPNSPGVKSGQLKPWRTAAEIIDWSLPCPSIFDRKKPLAEKTMQRIARGVRKFVLETTKPFIVTCNHAGEHFRGQGLDVPFKTLTASRDAHGIVVPQLMHYRDQPGGKPRFPKMDEPVPTITAGGITQALLAPTLVQTGYGEREGQKPRCLDLQAPLGTIVAQGVKHSVAVAHLIKHFGGNNKSAGVSLDEPVHTITSVDHHALATVNLIRHFGTGTGHAVDEPARTIMADGGGKIGLVAAFLDKYNGANKFGQALDKPAHTLTSVEGFSLVTVTIEGQEYVLTDIGMRMLQPHELYKAQGFPDNYNISPMFNGKPFTKEAQVKMVGNSVPPLLTKVLVEANLASELRQVANRRKPRSQKVGAQ